MRSERSTIWATSPNPLGFELASEQNPWYISFRFVTNCQFFPIVSQNKIELSKSRKGFGDAGHRSPYLSHAKRALYHLSYIPVPFKLRASFWTKFMKYQLSICNELPIPSHYQQTPNGIVEASKCFGDARHRSTHPSHAKRALYQLSYIPVLFKLRGSLWTKFMIDQLSICNQLSILSFCQSEQNRIVEASKMYWDAGQRSLYLTC